MKNFYYISPSKEFFLTVSFLFVMANPAIAANETSVKLSPLLSTAHPINNANISIIDNSFIQNTQAQSLGEIFNKGAEMQVGGGAKIGQKLYIRGFEDRMFRIRIDGITQSGNIFHHQGNMLFNPLLVKNIEIQKGLANIENGPGALAGGIDITFKNAFDMLQNKNYGANFTLGGQTNRGVDSSLIAYGKLKENLGLLAGYSFDDMPFYRAGNGDKVPSSKSKSHNTYFKLTFLPNESHSANLNYSFNYLNTIAPFAANVITNTNPTLFDNKLNTHNASMQYSYTPSDNYNILWNNYYSHKSLSFVNIGLESHIDNSNTENHNHEEEPMNLSLTNLGSDLGFKHYFSDSRHLIKYGLNYQLIMSKAHSFHGSTASNRGAELGSIYGAYLGATFNLLSSLSLDIGSRYDSFIYRDAFNTKHNTKGFSPYISLLYAPTDDLSFKLTHNYNTRGAIPLDASLLYNEKLNIVRLRAENMYNTEFNIDYDNSFFSLRASVYYQQLQNFINSYTNQNGNEKSELTRKNMERVVHVYGYEANIGFDFSFIDAHLGVAQSSPKYASHLITDTYELATVSGRSYYASLGMHPFSALPQFQILYLMRFVENINFQGYNLYFGEIEHLNKKGYNTHSIYITYDVKPSLSLRLAFLNITNKTYTNPYSAIKENFTKETGVALYEPGFNIKGQIAFFF